MTFRVGQKVVCIAGDLATDWTVYTFKLSAPEKDGIYTIRGMLEWNGECGLWLEELRNPLMSLTDGTFGEVGFWASHFRPLVERKTDISIFQELLAPTSPRVLEPMR